MNLKNFQPVFKGAIAIMKTLTQKTLQVKLKEGWGRDNFTQELQITENELENAIDRLYKSQQCRNKVLKRLDENDKLNFKRNKQLANNSAQEVTVEAAYEPETPTFFETLEPENPVSETMAPSREEKIQDVLEKIEQARKEVLFLEQQHINSVATRKDLYNKIEDTQGKLLKIKKQLEELENNLQENIDAYNAEEAKMHNLNEQISKEKSRLEDLEKEKEELEKVTILVYNSGIEIDDKLLKEEMLPERWKEIYQSFFGDEMFDNLTGAQSKTLAKVLAYIETLEKFNICFDSVEMEQVFNKICCHE